MKNKNYKHQQTETIQRYPESLETIKSRRMQNKILFQIIKAKGNGRKPFQRWGENLEKSSG